MRTAWVAAFTLLVACDSALDDPPFDGIDADDPDQSSVEPGAEQVVPQPGLGADSLPQLAVERAAAWRTRFGANGVVTTTTTAGWEVYFDGVDTPADMARLVPSTGGKAPLQLAWDVPVDDDFRLDQGETAGIRPNTIIGGVLGNSPGFYTVHRPVVNVNGIFPRGFIQRLDDRVTLASGSTVEARIRVYPSTPALTVAIQQSYPEGSFSLYFDPPRGTTSGRVAFSNRSQAPREPAATADYALDTTSYHTYRIVRAPGSRVVNLYINGRPDVRATYSLDSAPNIAGETPRMADILVGKNSTDSRATFEIDYVAYTRGAFVPGTTIGTAYRTPFALPPHETATERLSFPGRNTGDAVPATFNYSLDPLPRFPVDRAFNTTNGQAWKAVGGVLELSTATMPSYRGGLRYQDPGYIDPAGDWTLQYRLKIDPANQQHSIQGWFMDHFGGVSLVWSPDAVSLMMGAKSTGIVSFPMDTTDQFHTYRLVHKRGELVVHLYIDGNPTPAISDYHLEHTRVVVPNSNHTERARLDFGAFGKPFAQVAPARVWVDSILWQAKALAPPL
jgi:hypothetical protein